MLFGVITSALVARAEDRTLTFQASVPFDFVIGKQNLPAGTYIFQRLIGKQTEKDAMGVVVIKSSNGNVYKTIITGLSNEKKPARRSKLLFTTYQGRHYLNEMWVAGDRMTQRLASAPVEGTSGQSEIGLVKLQ